MANLTKEEVLNIVRSFIRSDDAKLLFEDVIRKYSDTSESKNNFRIKFEDMLTGLDFPQSFVDQLSDLIEASLQTQHAGLTSAHEQLKKDIEDVKSLIDDKVDEVNTKIEDKKTWGAQALAWGKLWSAAILAILAMIISLFS